MASNSISNEIKQMAMDCVSEYFADCDYIAVVNCRDIRVKSSKMFVNVDGKLYTMRRSKTSKVAHKDAYKCLDCQLTAKDYALLMMNKSSKTYILAYIGNTGRKFIPLTKDHIVPRLLGGSDAMVNLQCLCYECNQLKSHSYTDKPIEESNHRIITIRMDEYNALCKKQSDFTATRENIKRTINKLPWYYRILGVGKFLERRIKAPIEIRGYYGYSLTKNNKLKR